MSSSERGKKIPVFLAKNKEASDKESSVVAVAQVAVTWDPRTRRLGYKGPAAANGGAKVGDSSSRSEGVDADGSGSDGGGKNDGKNRERANFAVPLPRKEIEEDFMAMTGHRPPRRPKKRNRTV
ncbi:uncharacterized protein LOC115756288 [Rhodamnia argentea]|uniref:Uncharacterized protein LOC115756288 n=1 Tax=Rhodamnia argentea TaxID=178133 RepID=A0A8B8QZT7_9MYRT|nr:uncharacterized protein LOC115756288 [Rhodamnia argentea]